MVGSTKPYLVLAYLIYTRPNWYLGYTAFFDQPYSEQSVADFVAMVASTSVAP